MLRIRQILMDLFRQVLGEHGQDAPSLDDIIIERAWRRLPPSLVAQFSNGQRVSARVQAADFYSFCERYAAWDLASLRVALVREGQVIYQRMLENQRERERACHAARQMAQQNHRPRMRGTLQGFWLRALSAGTFLSTNADRRANARGLQLLTQNLSPAQRNQYETCGYFEVVGGATGKRYRIKTGYQMNVEELDKTGKRVRLLCFMPEGGLVVGDIMLAQKLALELFEADACAVANFMPRQLRRLEFP